MEIKINEQHEPSPASGLVDVETGVGEVVEGNSLVAVAVTEAVAAATPFSVAETAAVAGTTTEAAGVGTAATEATGTGGATTVSVLPVANGVDSAAFAFGSVIFFAS